MTAPFQLFPQLPAAVEAALRESIQRFGVLVPVAVDQHGNVLDGHHRQRIAAELGVDCRMDVHQVADDDEAREIARTLNSDRRHLTEDQRREVVAALRGQGHSLRAIAGAVGVDQRTVQRDVDRSIAAGAAIEVPERVQRQGGGTYPARRTEPQLPAEPLAAASNVVAFPTSPQHVPVARPVTVPERRPAALEESDSERDARDDAETVLAAIERLNSLLVSRYPSDLARYGAPDRLRSALQASLDWMVEAANYLDGMEAAS